MERVIYLDIDGVLSRPGFETKEFFKFLGVQTYGFWASAVARLNELSASADADVVIHSTWRLAHPASWLLAFVRHQGVERVRGLADLTQMSRGNAVGSHMKEHMIPEFIIIDDEPSQFDGHPLLRDSVVATGETTGYDVDAHARALAFVEGWCRNDTV